MAKQQPPERDEHDRANFQRRQEYLDSAAHLHAEIVDPRHYHDHKCCQWLRRREGEFLVPYPAREEWRAYRGKEESHEPYEASSQPCHGDGPVKKRTHPPEQETPDRPKPAAQVDIGPTRSGKSCPKLGITECPQ